MSDLPTVKRYGVPLRAMPNLAYEPYIVHKNGIIGGVSVNNLKQLFIPLPPHEEIKRIVEKIKQILKGIEG